MKHDGVLFHWLYFQYPLCNERKRLERRKTNTSGNGDTRIVSLCHDEQKNS